MAIKWWSMNVTVLGIKNPTNMVIETTHQNGSIMRYTTTNIRCDVGLFENGSCLQIIM